MLQANDFKIRCSAIGKIMAGKLGLTENQEATIIKHQTRLDAYLKATNEKERKKLKLTDSMEKELAELLHRKSNPELPDGAKTYCRDWLKGQVLGKRKEIVSKYMTKGLLVEDIAIDFASEVLKWPLSLKNTKRIDAEWIMGECDLIYPDCVRDIKCSWSIDTFPLMDTECTNSDYYGQAQGYMYLYERDKFELVYCLIDSPDHLIESAINQKAFHFGYDKEDIRDEITAQMTFGDIPDHLRVKVFQIERNDAYISEIENRVKLCRKYINQLITEKKWVTTI